MPVELSKEGQRVYLVNLPFEMKDEAKRILGMNGSNFDRERKCWWVGTAKWAEAEKFVAKVNGGQVESKQESIDDIRLEGKASHKGRTYYVRAITKDGQRAWLITLDGKVDFWAGLTQLVAPENRAVIVKRYQPRERRPFYGRGPTTYEYMTLGSIRRFIEKQADPKTRRGECSECGHFGPSGQACSECGGEGTHMG